MSYREILSHRNCFGLSDEWVYCGPYRQATREEIRDPNCEIFPSETGELLVPVRKNNHRSNGEASSPQEYVLTEGIPRGI
ncbi:hypothetical protein C4577_00510 [Candidatus Parcubacteria bacterium]|nr:MAG: hypothetical protein C4577_00510 [Candidatus Parcubacteria bacterium]